MQFFHVQSGKIVFQNKMPSKTYKHGVIKNTPSVNFIYNKYLHINVSWEPKKKKKILYTYEFTLYSFILRSNLRALLRSIYWLNLYIVVFTRINIPYHFKASQGKAFYGTDNYALFSESVGVRKMHKQTVKQLWHKTYSCWSAIFKFGAAVGKKADDKNRHKAVQGRRFNSNFIYF